MTQKQQLCFGDDCGYNHNGNIIIKATTINIIEKRVKTNVNSTFLYQFES